MERCWYDSDGRKHVIRETPVPASLCPLQVNKAWPGIKPVYPQREAGKFSVPTAQKTLRLHYKHQLVRSVEGNNRCLVYE
jgi:hypothetical protein